MLTGTARFAGAHRLEVETRDGVLALDFAHAIGMRPLHGTTQELSLGTAAAAHVCATLEILDVASYPAGPMLYTADCTRTPIRYENSAIVVPDGPGLGIEIEEEHLETLRYAS